MDSLEEWASEGESKRVDETERTLRYQIRHMTVCNERIREVSSRVAPQENDSCPSIWIGTGFFVPKFGKTYSNPDCDNIITVESTWTKSMWKALRAQNGGHDERNNQNPLQLSLIHI